jgi:hypothetical protein
VVHYAPDADVLSGVAFVLGPKHSVVANFRAKSWCRRV